MNYLEKHDSVWSACKDGTTARISMNQARTKRESSQYPKRSKRKTDNENLHEMIERKSFPKIQYETANNKKIAKGRKKEGNFKSRRKPD